MGADCGLCTSPEISWVIVGAITLGYLMLFGFTILKVCHPRGPRHNNGPVVAHTRNPHAPAGTAWGVLERLTTAGGRGVPPGPRFHSGKNLRGKEIIWAIFGTQNFGFQEPPHPPSSLPWVRPPPPQDRPPTPPKTPVPTGTAPTPLKRHSARRRSPTSAPPPTHTTRHPHSHHRARAATPRAPTGTP